jgi:hypothetical protein
VVTLRGVERPVARLIGHSPWNGNPGSGQHDSGQVPPLHARRAGNRWPPGSTSSKDGTVCDRTTLRRALLVPVALVPSLFSVRRLSGPTQTAVAVFMMAGLGAVFRFVLDLLAK